MLLGILSLRPEQEVEYATEIALRAQQYPLDVVRFTPFQILPVSEEVHGLKFDQTKKRWVKDTFPLPAFIYDRCFYNQTALAKKGKPIVEWLKKRAGTTFLGYGLPDKLQTYDILSRHLEAAPYIPYTTEATTDHVWKYVWRHKEAIIKPIHGSQGNGICRVSYGQKALQTVIQQGKNRVSKSFLSKEELLIWLDAQLQTQTYMLQPFLSIQDRQKRPFDIRILLQKNKEGRWIEAGRGVRYGETQGLVSNIHAGSSMQAYEVWRQSCTKEDLLLLEDNISTLIHAVPAALEAALPPLFEIGLDISVDRNGAVWLLDVNSKPGRKVLLACQPHCADALYEAPLAYCHHLLLQAQKGGDHT